MPTRADRLNACLVAVSPTLKAAVASGTWPADEKGKRRSPYVIDKVRNGHNRITITVPETGDTISGTGPTLDAALDQLERRLSA